MEAQVRQAHLTSLKEYQCYTTHLQTKLCSFRTLGDQSFTPQQTWRLVKLFRQWLLEGWLEKAVLLGSKKGMEQWSTALPWFLW